MSGNSGVRIGLDLGGTKIEITALGPGGAIVARERISTPRNDYDGTIRALAELVRSVEARLATRASVGVAIPGTISTVTGLVKNANSVGLIGHPLDRDLANALGRPIRVANDANCFALSEATDGAARDAYCVFGVIAGTGVGGGVVIARRVLKGANGIAGEWGHNPLPAPLPDELPGPACYCGKRGCIESWLSGPALERQYREKTGDVLVATEIAAKAEDGGGLARDIMERYFDRFARALATVVNILDPDCIVLGGGLSRIDAFYRELPTRVMRYAFTPERPINIVKNIHGDASGVRGAAWLWPEDEIIEALGP